MKNLIPFNLFEGKILKKLLNNNFKNLKNIKAEELNKKGIIIKVID